MDAIAFGSSLGREKLMPRNTAKTRKTTAARVDVYEEVTNQIVALLEAGTRPWSPRWASGAASLPLRHEGTAYRGINILLLWSAAMALGYTNPHWMTYRQAHELGGQVRKGEKGNLVVHAGTFTPKDGETGEPITDSEGEETSRAYLKRYVVFNVEQIDGLDMSKFPAPLVEIKNRDERDPELDAAFTRYPVPYREGGNSAYYHPVADSIAMPAFGDFVSGNAFYATLAHEAIHSTGHMSRLNRETLYEYGKSKEIRAAEELIAEIGAAMLCAQLGMEPTEREDHASYLASWLTALRNDKRAIFRAATAAQAGSELILSHMAAPGMSRAA
jgi:antirestriction protein ArdC